MLDNFMHLVAAVIIGGTLSVMDNVSGENGVIRSTAAIYCDEYQAYLKGVIDLYPTAKIKPNMHISYHVGELLQKYSPVHSWRAFVFERFIGLIQNTATNMHVGVMD